MNIFLCICFFLNLGLSNIIGQTQVYSITYLTTRNARNPKSPIERCDSLSFHFDQKHCFASSCSAGRNSFDAFKALNFYYDLDSMYYMVVHNRLKAVDYITCTTTAPVFSASQFDSIASSKRYVKGTKTRILNQSCTSYILHDASNPNFIRAIYWVADSLYLPDAFVYKLSPSSTNDSASESIFPSFVSTGRAVMGIDRFLVNPRTFALDTISQKAVFISTTMQSLPVPEFVTRAKSDNYKVYRNASYSSRRERRLAELHSYGKGYMSNFFNQD